MALSTILIIVLILVLVGALPTWPYSRDWGYYPGGALGLILVIVIILLLMGAPLNYDRGKVAKVRGALRPVVAERVGLDRSKPNPTCEAPRPLLSLARPGSRTAARTPRPRSTGCGRGSCPERARCHRVRTGSRTPSDPSSRATRTPYMGRRRPDLPTSDQAGEREAFHYGPRLGLSRGEGARLASGGPPKGTSRSERRCRARCQGAQRPVRQPRKPDGRRAESTTSGTR